MHDALRKKCRRIDRARFQTFSRVSTHRTRSRTTHACLRMPRPSTLATLMDKDTPNDRQVLDELVSRPLVDVAAEVALLRNERDRLKDRVCLLEDANQELEATVSNMTSKLEALRKVIRVLKNTMKPLLVQGGYVPAVGSECRGPLEIQSLPPELLLRILRHTRSPRFQNDPSVLQGPGSLWMAEFRVRKNFVLVCKGWSETAMELLYEDIVLRRMGQIPALAHTLINGPRRLSHLVKSIRMDSCVVLWPCVDAVRDGLRVIFQQCTSLRTFEFRPLRGVPVLASPSPSDADRWRTFNPAWFLQGPADIVAQAFHERLSTTLRTLDLRMPLMPIAVTELHQLLSSAVCLGSLKLGTVPRRPTDGAVNPSLELPPLQLGELVELEIDVNEPRFCEHVCKVWVMPKLGHLTARNSTTVPRDLLITHGQRLVYLNVFPKNSPDGFDDKAVKHIYPTWCPVLQHLVFPTDQTGRSPHLTDWGNSHPDSSSTLRYIDIWSSQYQITHRTRVLADQIRERWNLPSWTGLRRLTHCSQVVDLPMICHPSKPLTDDETLIWRFPQLIIAQRKYEVAPVCSTARIHRYVFPWLADFNQRWPDYGEDDSATWNPDENDSADDESWSGSSREDEGTGDGSNSEDDSELWGPEVQLGLDQVVSRFQSIQLEGEPRSYVGAWTEVDYEESAYGEPEFTTEEQDISGAGGEIVES
ncbi:hypothetical protein C8Q78DRAFT_1017524 [Trametes maxima]|nr:hypothetical protein C8Q78DRAFT_1017524 [Trametes maxima]